MRMKALTDSGVFWVATVMLLAVLFMLPTLIGLVRGVDQLALVFLVNLIGAPALIGWPAALILAFGPRRRPPQPPRLTWHSTEYGPAIFEPGPDRW
jgi:hypothetical protein